jgi:hypothetical protein
MAFMLWLAWIVFASLTLARAKKRVSAEAVALGQHA